MCFKNQKKMLISMSDRSFSFERVTPKPNHRYYHSWGGYLATRTIGFYTKR